MTSASATGGKKRGRRRHQTVIEQSSGLDRVFIWDIDSSLVPGDMIGQSIEPSVLPSVADKLGNLSKKLREMTLSFCDQHMFLSEVESSDQMHIDDIPKDLEQAAPATATGLTSSPPANQQPASPAALQLYEQPANQQLPVVRQDHPGNGYPQDHYAEAPPTGGPTAAYADYQQQQQQQFHNHHNQLAADQQGNRQEHNSPLEIPFQVQKVEPPESSYVYPSNSSSSTLIEDISVSSAAAAAAAAAAYAHSEPLWVEPIHQHHFQVPSTIHHHHHHHQQHHHQEAQYSFDQAQHQHIQHYQPAVHYHEQQHQQSASEQNGLVYQADFGQHQHHQQPPAVASAYPDYQHQFHHNHHHSQHQQAQEQQQHQEQQGVLAGYQLAAVEPPETKYAYSSSCVAPSNAVADASGAPAAAYASEPLWVEPNNNHHFLTPAHHEPHYLFEQTSHHQLEPCQYQQPEQHQLQHQPEAGQQQQQQQSSVEQNGNGNGYQQEFAAPNTTPAYQHDQYQQQQPFGQQQPQETQHHHHNHNHHSHNHHHHIQTQNHNQQQQQNEQQELLRPASNLNSKLQVIDSAFLNKPLKNVLSSHHSRLAYKLSVRYNRIKTIYNNFRFDLKAKDPKLHDELETILTEIDRYTLDWRKRSMDCLKLILESNNCTNLIVTKLPLVVALGHLICLNLGQYFDVDQIYSAIRTNSKEACIKRIKKRFGATNRCSYIIVGDREDVEMAKKLSLPSWITTRSDGHRQLLQLYTALKEGYLM